MIKQLINNGFKDQYRRVTLTGLDFFSSDNVNGVGKSAVLEAFKLALLGEIPGKARNLEDILEFTSQPEMSVEILAELRKGTVTVEREFHRYAQSGEKRPIRINHVLRKYEEGNQWVLDNLGAVSVSFDPHEFLNLSSQKKRQWIIAHSPESQAMNKAVVYATGLVLLMQQFFGVGLIQSILKSYGMRSAEDLWKEDFFDGANRLSLGEENLNRTARLIGDLVQAFRDQDAVLSVRVLEKMDQAFSSWDDSISPEENISQIQGYLKSEISSTKTLMRLNRDALSTEADTSPIPINSPYGLDAQITEEQTKLKLLEERIDSLATELAEEKQIVEAAHQMERRKARLRDAITSLKLELAGEIPNDLRGKLEKLRERIEDPQPLQMDHLELSRDLKMKKKKWAEIGSSIFQCPVAKKIKCDTDMESYKEGLKKEIDTLSGQDKEKKEILKRTEQELWVAGKEVKSLGKKINQQYQDNKQLEKEIELLSPKLSFQEEENSRAKGMLKVYQEELETLQADSDATPEMNEEGLRIKKSEKQELEQSKSECVNRLTDLLRRQGRVEANRELLRKRLWAEEQFNILNMMSKILGPEGIQNKIANRAAEGLEEETNGLLQWMDESYKFTLDLSGKKFQMGWNRDGKIIPFTTINSAHFILFVVPFLTALLNRLARLREKAGQPTLKALCVEAESMTPDNLVVLLKGLSVMKRHGYLDNVLVAHYGSIRDRRKLSGFKETILRNEDDQTAKKINRVSPVLVGSAG